MVDTALVAQRFSEAADTYDAWAQPHSMIARAMCPLLPSHATSVLDIGCGTGIMTQFLQEKYAKATIIGIDPAEGMVKVCQKKWRGDQRASFLVTAVEQYEPAQQFEVIVASSCFHWVNDKRGALERIRQWLVPGGHFAIAVMVEGAMPELCQSFTVATGKEMGGIPMATAHEYIQLLMESGLTVKHLSTETLKMSVPDPAYVINSLRGIGAAPDGLGDGSRISESQLKTLVDYYKTHFSDGLGVWESFRFVRAVLQKPSEGNGALQHP